MSDDVEDEKDGRRWRRLRNICYAARGCSFAAFVVDPRTESNGKESRGEEKACRNETVGGKGTAVKRERESKREKERCTEEDAKWFDRR